MAKRKSPPAHNRDLAGDQRPVIVHKGPLKVAMEPLQPAEKTWPKHQRGLIQEDQSVGDEKYGVGMIPSMDLAKAQEQWTMARKKSPRRPLGPGDLGANSPGHMRREGARHRRGEGFDGVGMPPSPATAHWDFVNNKPLFDPTAAAQHPQRKEDKRKLLDLCLAGQVMGMDEKVRQKLYFTKNFVLDASASYFMGQLVKDVAKEMLDQHRWARGPYPLCWIEMDHPAYWEGLGLEPGGPEATRDHRVGILWDHGVVHLVSSSQGGHMPACATHTFEFDREPSLEEELRVSDFYGFSRLVTRMEMLGTSANLDDPWWESESFRSIFQSITIRITKFGESLRNNPKVTENDRRRVLAGNAGDLKLVICLLLLVCRPHKQFMLTEVGHERKLIKGRAMTLKAHSVISLRLEHDQPVKRFIKGFQSGIHRQRHDVKGHWCESRRVGRGSCEHVWQWSDPDHAQCLKCERKRWWKRSHQRGKTQIGTSTGEYDVTR